MKSVLYSCQTLMKIESFKYIFEKAPNIKFMKISRIGAKLFHANRHIDIQTDRWTDKRVEANNRFSKFCESAK
jgi:hypothetical protein